MLERATACLKSGALREPLGCTRSTPKRSRRMLHAGFWTQAPGDLDVPPLFPSRTTSPPPIGDPTSIGTAPSGVFLDFLYPPQALAWLQQRQTQRLQTWERRNKRRLPDGFVVASRRHASRSYHPLGRDADGNSRRDTNTDRRSSAGRKENMQDVVNNQRQSEGTQRRSQNGLADGFSPFPGDLADPMVERSQQQRESAPVPAFDQSSWTLKAPSGNPSSFDSVRPLGQARQDSIDQRTGLNNDVDSKSAQALYTSAPAEPTVQRASPGVDRSSDRQHGRLAGNKARFEIGLVETDDTLPYDPNGIDSHSGQISAPRKPFTERLDFHKNIQSDSVADHPPRKLLDATLDNVKIENAAPSDSALEFIPGDSGDTTLNRTKLLRNLLKTSQQRHDGYDASESEALTKRAWAIYKSLNHESQGDVRLKQELLHWLASQATDVAAAHCMEVFRSIPSDSRTIEVYRAVITLQMQRDDRYSIMELHKQALHRFENGYVISRQVFERALREQKWDVAMAAANTHISTYIGMNRQNQVKLFWIHVSDIPKLYWKAARLARHMGFIEGLRLSDTQTRTFCFCFFKEAITQEFMQSDSSMRSFGKQDHPPRESVQSMFRHIIELDPRADNFLLEVMRTALSPHSGIRYAGYHQTFSWIYQEFCRLPGAVPPVDLLYVFLERVGQRSKDRGLEENHETSVDTSRLINDWKHYHGELSLRAINLLLSQYASRGDQDRFEKMAEYQDATYPGYADRKDSLWTRIYLHARRADLDSAQQAFAEVARIAGEHNDQPSLQCWNVLLHAHARVDDLEGALTNFDNIINHAKLQPDSYSFSPLFLMLAKRGDVEGLQEMFQHFEEMVDEPKSPDTMLSLMIAHFNRDENLEAAEDVLKRTIDMKQQGDVVGSLTPCFNALIGFYAMRRDIDGALRIYRSMREEKARLNSETFASIMQALLYHRQLTAASTILKEVMAEHHVYPTAHHYALMMAAYNKQNMHKYTLDLHRRMLSMNVKPTLSTQVSFLKAKAKVEHRAGLRPPPQDESSMPALTETLSELNDMISQYDQTVVAARYETTPMSDRLDLDDPFAAYFDSLIYIHGQRRCFQVVQALLKQYNELPRPKRSHELPIRMLSALMSVHCRAGEHDKVEEYWNLAKEQAGDIARSVRKIRVGHGKQREEAEVDASKSEALGASDMDDQHAAANQKLATSQLQDESGGTSSSMPESIASLFNKKPTYETKLSVARRHLLDRPLRWYLMALWSEARTGDAINVVTQLLSQGHILGKRTWNMFIRQLLDTRPPLALLAFVLTERFMMPHFPGWFPKRTKIRPADRVAGLEHIRARYIRRNQIMPEYGTFVRLGAALLDLRRMELHGRDTAAELPENLRKFVGTVSELRAKAGRTVNAVQTMPAVHDERQAKWLRYED